MTKKVYIAAKKKDFPYESDYRKYLKNLKKMKSNEIQFLDTTIFLGKTN